MAEITAAAVKSLREKTGLPMMDCKAALAESNGDEQGAIEYLRKKGIKTQETRLGRETSAGRIAVFVDAARPVAAMVELKCESAPVANHDDFKQLAADLAKQLATGPGAATGDELLTQPSPSHPGKKLGDIKDDLFNRMREVFQVGRIIRVDAPCGVYAHHDGSMAALVEITGSNMDAAKDIAMHVVAQRPAAVSKEDLDPAIVDKEREILSEAARKEGKPENIIAKMIEGRLKNFYAERVLNEQPFIKDDKQTVSQYAKSAGIAVKKFAAWVMGKE
ncbi:MAG: translation elongation factor Ts [Pirellulales bacterium]|nr:translation elongation factor Ts [Pirellulales bacterium]